MEIQFLDEKIEYFIASLEKSTVAKVLRTIDLLEMFGHELGLPHSKNIAKNLFELRVRGTQEVRLFYAFHERKALILHGFIKKSKRIPARELQIANKKLKDLEGL